MTPVVDDAGLEGPPADLLDEWFDYNGHLTDWAYARVLSEANERVLERLDLSADYLQRSGCSLFTVEVTLAYAAEVVAGDHLRARSRVADVSTRSLLLVTELVRDDDVVAAETRSRYVHVARSTGRPAPFDDVTAARLSALLEGG